MTSGRATFTLFTALLCACSTSDAPPRAEALTASTVAPIGGGDALTLAAQRHLVRIEPPGHPARWLLALQQDGAAPGGLGLFRSDDEGATWRYAAPIQGDRTERDTADLIAVGADLALVYSFEAPDLAGSARHDVYFQWWRYQSTTDTWAPSPPVRVFDSTSDATAYYRAELARDSLGRLWVQAFELGATGAHTAEVAVSTDGGASFLAQPALAALAVEGGGRLASLGTRMVFIWDGHDGSSPARLRTRADADPLASWGPETFAFAEGIYQGGSLSAVEDGRGGLHLAYHDKSDRLVYRRFDGTAFGAAQVLETQGDWDLEAALVRRGDELIVFYDRVIASGTRTEVRARRAPAGSFGDPVVLDGSAGWKGFPASAATVPTTLATLPCLFGLAATADDAGSAGVYLLPLGTASPPDLGAPAPDLAVAPDLAIAPDLAAPDLAAPPDLAPPPDLAAPPDLAPPPSGPLFSDDFARTVAVDSGLGPDWTLPTGLWWAHGVAETDSDAGNQATANRVRCADCKVSARVLGFGAPALGVFLRAPTVISTDRYELALLGTGVLQLRRVRAGAVTVLGQVPSGLASLDAGLTPISLEAHGAGPVTLTAAIGGTTVLTVSDASSAALTGDGFAGLSASSAGVWFDDFALAGTASAPPPLTCPYGSTPLAGGGCGVADLALDVNRMASELTIYTQTFDASACEVIEGCNLVGTRRLLSFGLLARNVGSYDLVLGDPVLDPTHFVYQSCHDHYHFRGYAIFRLLDANGVVVAVGTKQSFCVADTVPPATGSTTPFYHCDFQGISAGWGDVYGATTPCQDIDITGLPSGSYTLEVVVNPDRVFAETRYDNNSGRVPVTIP